MVFLMFLRRMKACILPGILNSAMPWWLLQSQKSPFPFQRGKTWPFSRSRGIVPDFQMAARTSRSPWAMSSPPNCFISPGYCFLHFCQGRGFFRDRGSDTGIIRPSTSMRSVSGSAWIGCPSTRSTILALNIWEDQSTYWASEMAQSSVFPGLG